MPASDAEISAYLDQMAGVLKRKSSPGVHVPSGHQKPVPLTSPLQWTAESSLEAIESFQTNFESQADPLPVVGLASPATASAGPRFNPRALEGAALEIAARPAPPEVKVEEYKPSVITLLLEDPDDDCQSF